MNTESVPRPPRTDAVRLERFRQELETELREVILPVYIVQARDREAGGFFGEIDANGATDKEAPRSLVLNSRILWTFSRACRVLRDPIYREVADEACNVLLRRFYDRRYGGFYGQVNRQGAPLHRIKATYGQGFAIYGLAEHYLTTGDETFLQIAMQTFQRLEEAAHDARFGGYFEARRRDWGSPWRYVLLREQRRLRKTANVHLHIMEALTVLVRASHDPVVAMRLREVMGLMLERSFDPHGVRFHEVCTRQWTPVPQPTSYGHDIEAAWLLREAASVLAAPELIQRVDDVAISVAAAVAARGQAPDGGVYRSGDRDGPVDRNRIWWVQAEALVGFFDAYQLTGETRFLDATLACWAFCRRTLSNGAGGEWRSAPVNETVEFPYRIGAWKGPYHNGRACMELMARVDALLSA